MTWVAVQEHQLFIFLQENELFEQSPILRWRKYKQQYTLQANQCIDCKKIYYPKIAVCKCGSLNFIEKILCGKGKLLTFTQINVSPRIYANNAPYCIGIIKLDEGPQIISQITDTKLEDLKISMPVKAVFRKYYSFNHEKIINYGIKFIPIDNS
ncbi:transcriptional regulator [Candidatus Dependentiae bacterium]|nr:transcriptional regulator [Candidatus Dependentiae bacterium]